FRRGSLFYAALRYHSNLTRRSGHQGQPGLPPNRGLQAAPIQPTCACKGSGRFSEEEFVAHSVFSALRLPALFVALGLVRGGCGVNNIPTYEEQAKAKL